ncbi:uncharacterized protein LOC117316633 [Pecten maximus]|uniref:uncharacterized protein LOC117316633 n=1 Tax=Pecten maximus TaxID=6579 RepID=UPI0014586C66|nr:uncharacterized protein LOC117316633 [Pecten maximus]
MKIRMTKKMSGQLIVLLLGLVVCVVIARNVETKSEDIEEENQTEDRDKRYVSGTDLLFQEWSEYQQNQQQSKEERDRNQVAMTEYLEARKMKFKEESYTKDKCTCSTYTKKGESTKICYPAGCQEQKENDQKQAV